MSEHDALLQAILADPAADLPRLVYADFIEERLGQHYRAEYIRADIELHNARMSLPVGKSHDPIQIDRIRDLAFRVRELSQHWVRPWNHKDEQNGLNTYGDRGLVDWVQGPLDVVMRTLPTIVRENPVMKVTVTDREPRARGTTAIGWSIKMDVSAYEPGQITDELPRETFALLESYSHKESNWFRYYPDTKSAHQALSDALLKWAK